MHRTASVNEYSTRYSEAIDSQNTTQADEWRLQSRKNKQGSSGLLSDIEHEEYPCTISRHLTEATGDLSREEFIDLYEKKNDFRQAVATRLPHFLEDHKDNPGTIWDSIKAHQFSYDEKYSHRIAKNMYDKMIEAGIAREQARKNLPLSTYTEAYWKIDLHNLFHFLRLRLDPHAQQEIREFAEVIAQIVQDWVPACWEAFVDYRLEAKGMSRFEIQFIRTIWKEYAMGRELTSGEEREVFKYFMDHIGVESKRERAELWRTINDE